jgi:hypothetical protein
MSWEYEEYVHRFQPQKITPNSPHLELVDYDVAKYDILEEHWPVIQSELTRWVAQGWEPHTTTGYVAVSVRTVGGDKPAWWIEPVDYKVTMRRWVPTSTIRPKADPQPQRVPVGTPARSMDELVAAAQTLIWHIDKAGKENAADRLEHLSVLLLDVRQSKLIPPEVCDLEREIPETERTWRPVSRTGQEGQNSLSAGDQLEASPPTVFPSVQHDGGGDTEDVSGRRRQLLSGLLKTFVTYLDECRELTRLDLAEMCDFAIGALQGQICDVPDQFTAKIQGYSPVAGPQEEPGQCRRCRGKGFLFGLDPLCKSCGGRSGCAHCRRTSFHEPCSRCGGSKSIEPVF